MDSLNMVKLFILDSKAGKFKKSEGKINWVYNKNLVKNYKYFAEVKAFFIDNYFTKGYGFKSLIKDYELGVSYTQLRNIFVALGIERRKGYNVVTDRLKEIRSENAKNKNYFTEWPKHHPELLKSSSNRGIQGYYYNKKLQKYVWLRSSYEYVYAKHLNNLNCIWDVECNYYNIKGRNYLPDFFIFTEDSVLVEIVEIKSDFYDRYLRDDFKNIVSFFKSKGITYKIIKEKGLAKLSNKSLGRMATEWKKIRRLNLEDTDN